MQVKLYKGKRLMYFIYFFFVLLGMPLAILATFFGIYPNNPDFIGTEHSMAVTMKWYFKCGVWTFAMIVLSALLCLIWRFA